jgi:hypothetical protein
MNANYKRLRPRFARETRFEVPAVVLRATRAAELDQLKRRLLQELVQESTDREQNALLRRAANDSAAMAWATGYPLLFFPALLEEKAVEARAQARLQKIIRKRSRSLTLQTV